MLSCLQNPNAVQLYVVPNLLRPGIIDSFVEDLEKSVALVNIIFLLVNPQMTMSQIMTQPNDELTGRAAVYGMAQTIPDKSLVSELVTGFMDVLYSTE